MRMLLFIFLFLPSLFWLCPMALADPATDLREIRKLLSPLNPLERQAALDPDVRRREAQAAWALQDWPRLAQASNAWLALEPNQPEAKSLLALAHLNLNQQEQALALFPDLPLGPENPADPAFAKKISYLLPGAGFAYLGHWGKALGSLALNLVFIKGMQDSWQQHQWATSMIFLTFEAGWYLGGANAAEEATIRQNQDRTKQLQWKFLRLEF